MLARAILETAVDRAWTSREVIKETRSELAGEGEQAFPLDDAVLEVLYTRGSLSRDKVLQHLAEEFAMPLVHLDGVRPAPSVLGLLTPEQAQKAQVLPLWIEGEALHVAIADPFDLEGLDNTSHLTGRAIEPHLASHATLRAAIARFYGMEEAAGEASAVVGGTVASEAVDTAEAEGVGDFDFSIAEGVKGDDGPIERYVQKLIGEALRLRASDIHLEPMERRFRVRFRVDGRLREVESPPKRLQPSILSRLKLMAGISIAEKRIPQDGRIRIVAQEREIDLRVSSLPSVFGETIVMRILDKEGLKMGLPELGFFSDDAAVFEELIAQPDGIFLVTGPTGSGKSTTLYAALHHINKPDRKIITVEDPVEYQLSGINQVQVHREIGMDFAAALRAMLRQAPNIIMVGEIRDRETAEIAINASLTGHMVFSTLHTNDAPSAVSRLVDIGVKPFLVAAALRGVLAQRLVRTICPKCGEAHAPDGRDLLAAGLPADHPTEGYRLGRGCVHCGGTGYRGRKGIFEMLRIDEAMQGLIYGQASLVELRQRARDAGMHSMREDGLRKAKAGITTIAEVLAVTVGEPN